MIEIAHRGRVAVMTLAHGKANALDSELCTDIVARFEELKPSTAQAVVLTGTAKIFSAGVDLKRAVEGGAAYLRDFLPVLSRAFATVFFYPKPVVAAVNGHAIAGGCVLACAADRRLMALGTGTMGVTELLVGVPFPTIAFEIMRFATAPQDFEETMFTGATYAPEAARERGFVHELVAPERLLDRAVAAAETLAALSPAAFALTKMQSRRAVQDTLQRAGASIDPAVHEMWLDPDTLARMRDYIARTLKKS
ncbi:MAG: enoyl-CoA hydratase/isomerase family protein [Xanthobacteraceae bacterium]|jgi:enoyl-CoA hydratase